MRVDHTGPARAAAKARRTTPNGPEPGTWQGGPYVLGRPCPPPGQAVVYTLWDDAGGRVYVGVSQHMSARLVKHRNSKDFTHWTAENCPNMAAARILEAELIRKHRPPLNRMGV